ERLKQEKEAGGPEPERTNQPPPVPRTRGQKPVNKPEPEPEPEPEPVPEPEPKLQPEPEPEPEDAPIYDDPDTYCEEGNDDDYENIVELPQQPAPKEEVGHQEDYEELAPCQEVVEADTENIYDIADNGLTAVALYDYQGEGSDEISFDPEDIITNIEMIDEGWWQGQCHGKTGVFPANYVKLQQ
ncbi:hypothetical protein scyTo_0016678, partial [Scyliorhinus torazame]|nr:hypothetical protein [Scyliorhinus torazame]